MTITLYRNSSIPNKVVKNLTQVTSITGTLRAGTSILSPSILLEGASLTSINYNYFKVNEWNRYYFLGPVEYGIKDTVTITGVVDVLMSFASDILKARAIIERQENLWNMYLNDNGVIMNQNYKHKIKKFPNSFNDFSYILALAGNGQTASND